MKKIQWCMKQKKGIELVEPNDNLSEKYFQEADDTLKRIKDNSGSKWDLIMGYYACYNSLYAILMKAGIKCEIHDCSIELMKLFKEFNDDDYSFLSGLKKKRIDAQYYLKDEFLENVTGVKRFVLKCHKIAEDLDISSLRKKLK